MRLTREELRTDLHDAAFKLVTVGVAELPIGAVHEDRPFLVELVTIRQIRGGVRSWGMLGRWLGFFGVGPVIAWRVWVREHRTQNWAEAAAYSHVTAAAEATALLIESL